MMTAALSSVTSGSISENTSSSTPSTTAHFIAQIGEPVATEDVIAYDEFMETRFYKEWAKPQQLVDCLNVRA